MLHLIIKTSCLSKAIYSLFDERGRAKVHVTLSVRMPRSVTRAPKSCELSTHKIS